MEHRDGGERTRTAFSPSFIQPFLPPASEGGQRLDREAGFLNDTDEDLADFQKSSKLLELYSATVPSVDSAMSSWDSSGFDAGCGSQGRPDGGTVVFRVLDLTVVVVFRAVFSQILRFTAQPKRVAAQQTQEPDGRRLRRPAAPFSNV